MQNEKTLQMTKYFDSLGNVKLNFDISEAFLWNWTLLWIIRKCGFFILILDANKHCTTWIIHEMKTEFGQLYSVFSLGTERVLMVHTTSQGMSDIFPLSLVLWPRRNGWISLILVWSVMTLTPVPFVLFLLCKRIRSCLVGAVKHSCLLRVFFRVEMVHVTFKVMQCEAVTDLPVDSLVS